MAVRFRVAFTHKQLTSERPDINLSELVVLEPSAWNDFNYVCTFRVVAYREDNTPVVLGEWKILDPESTAPSTTELPLEFTAIPIQFVSLGQEVAAYERLREIPLDRREAILVGLRDLLTQPLPKIETKAAFGLALARFSEAKEVFRNRTKLLEQIGLAAEASSNAEGALSDLLNVGVRATLPGFDHAHEFSLSFSGEPENLGLLRTAILVGPNGTGKTQLLAALARAFSGLDGSAAVVTPASPFTVAIAVSYGAFDRFTRPDSTSGRAKSYLYCGLREPGDARRLVINVDAVIDRTQRSIQELLLQDERRKAWNAAMDAVGLSGLASRLEKNPLRTQEELRKLSAGWQILAMTVTDLSASLRQGAVVLYDEPETHLHPRLLSALLRALRQLLETFDSFAIIATHSLIPVQEAPKSSIVVLRLHPEAGVMAGSPAMQSFASPLDDIERDVFGARHEDLNYQALLEQLAVSPKADVTKLLGNDLGFGARLTLAALRDEATS